jgi:hypothetical protein
MKRFLIFYLGVFSSVSVHASATANEFIPCKKKAVAILEYCLADDGKQCWKKSKLSFDTCHKQVIENHKRHSDNAKEDKRKQSPVTLEDNGDCAYINKHDDYLCLFIEDMVEGWVNSKLVVKSSNQTIVDTQTYLTAMNVQFSPNKNIFMVSISSEGHPSFGFYDTKRAFKATTELRADWYLDEYYFGHFEYIQDNGDVVFSLSEQSGGSCEDFESEGQQIHTANCLSGFNVFSKQVLTFNESRLCVN